jgi:hypothetical protein
MSLMQRREGAMGGQVKRVGLIGGTSWQSTLEYYRLINQRLHVDAIVARALG